MKWKKIPSHMSSRIPFCFGMPKMCCARQTHDDKHPHLCAVLCVCIYSIEKAFIFNTFKWKSPILSANVDGPINFTLLTVQSSVFIPATAQAAVFAATIQRHFTSRNETIKKQHQQQSYTPETITYGLIREWERKIK